jgi:hypothetical protein
LLLTNKNKINERELLDHRIGNCNESSIFDRQ